MFSSIIRILRTAGRPADTSGVTSRVRVRHPKILISTTSIIALTAFLLAPLQSRAAPEPVFDLLQSAAASAFRSGDFEAAEIEFRALSEQYPNNTDVLRFFAVTLDRIGKYTEAIDIFSKILELKPNSASTRYHLGVTLYKAHLTDAATEQFGYVLQLATQSKYAELAQEYINAIAEQRASLQRQGAVKRFGVFAQLAYSNDDNIPAIPDHPLLAAIEREGTRGSEYVALDYHFLRKPDWTGSLKLSGYGTQYSDDVFSGFEVFQYSAGALLQRHTRFGKMPVTGKIDYEYSKVELGEDRDPYSETHKATFSGLFHLKDNQSATLHYQLSEDDFEHEGFAPAISSRDADNREAGLSYTVYFADKRGDFTLYARYEEDDATGLNYNREATVGGITLRFPLFWNSQLKLGAEYTEDEYPDFTGPLLRETDVREYSVELSRWFGQHVLARLTWSDHDEESSYPSLTYRRKAWGLDVSYVY